MGNNTKLVKAKTKPTFYFVGLSHAVFKGIIRKGYKVPTPIQRKTIPLIMDGKYIFFSSKYVPQNSLG